MLKLDADPVSLCLAGEISVPTMLARLVMNGASVAAVREILAARPEARSLRAQVETRMPALQKLHTMWQRAAVDHDSAGGPGSIAAQFDTAVMHAPEAAVAAYSLGDPDLLAEATAELVAWLKREALLPPGADVLDLGCGIGRVAAALIPPARSVLGVDVSKGMIAEANRRHGDIAGLTLRHTEGYAFDFLPSGVFDLVLAVDSFPYLLMAGSAIAARHIADAARVLRPAGALAIFNVSYAADPAADIATMSDWAAAAGFRPLHRGEQPFSIWDATVFTFRRLTSPGGPQLGESATNSGGRALRRGS
jgi:SAM-dependent methyltransferase